LKNDLEKVEQIPRLELDDAFILESPRGGLHDHSAAKDDLSKLRHPLWEVCVVAVKSDTRIEPADTGESARAHECIATDRYACSEAQNLKDCVYRHKDIFLDKE